ncbi:MAG: CHASE3 domain-containing protein [Pseudomonadota bacterium]
MKIGRKLAFGFGSVLGIFLFVIGMSYKNFTQFKESDAWNIHTYQVIINADNVLIALINIETGQRGFAISGKETFLEPLELGKTEFDIHYTKIKELTSDNPKQQERLAKLLEAKNRWMSEGIEPLIATRRGVADNYKTMDRVIATFSEAKGKALMDTIRVILDNIKEEEDRLLVIRTHAMENLKSQTDMAMIVGSVTGFFISLFLAFFIIRSVTRPISEIISVANRLAEGDLTLQIDVGNRADEIGALQRAFQSMIGKLRELNRDLREGVGVLASSSTEIFTTVSQLATGAAETATAVSETSTTAEEVKQTAHLSHQKAKNVQESAQKTAAVSETGHQAVTKTIEGMHHIREQMESIAESVVRLSEQGQAISEIIATVNDLAEQSNLLAVNAALEATRAGEYGKEFAVVAQEVKSLAEQSRQATAQVRVILMEVQKATSSAVMATEQGTKVVAAGVRQATEAGDSIRALASNIGEAAQAATQIAASNQQQLVGMDQIALAIANIRQATSQNLAGTQQLKASAQSLQAFGERLKTLVERQRLEN